MKRRLLTATLALAVLLLPGCGRQSPQRASLAQPFVLTGECTLCGCDFSISFVYRGADSCELAFLAPESVVGLRTELSADGVHESYLGIEREPSQGAHPFMRQLCDLFDAAAPGGPEVSQGGDETVLRCGVHGEITLFCGTPTSLVLADGTVVKVTGFEQLSEAADAG